LETLIPNENSYKVRMFLRISAK